MQFGTLTFTRVIERLDLVAPATARMLRQIDASETYVCEIDASLADTAAFCEAYDIGLDQGANCVIVEAKRADKVWYAACVVLSSDKIDINGAVRRQLGAKKVSFAPMDIATKLTVMEYGGITPVGLPAEWSILIDSAVVRAGMLVIGSGVRASKLLTSGELLAALPEALVVDIAKLN